MADDSTQRAVSGTRRGDIQGLRAVAVLLVVVYHADLGLSGGFVGVDIFFVISGYVITRTLTAELGRTDRVGLGRFYVRRIRRLLPALGLMLTVVMLASSLLSPIGGQQITARTGAAAALFSANTYLIRFGGAGYFDVDANVNALLHTWSLSVEEQFYFVFPATLFAVWALGRRFSWLGTRVSLAGALVLISVLSFLLSWALTSGRFSFLGIDVVDDFSEQFAFYSSLTRAWEFAVGGLLALASRRLSTLAPATEWMLVTVGVALVGYSAIRFDDLTPFPGAAALVPVAGTLCVLAAGEGRSANFVSRGLACRPAQRVGDLSYSWYLWHWPFIVFAAAWWPRTGVAAPAAALISLAPAWLSYRFVEGPIRFAPRPAMSRTVILAALCVLLPIGSAFALVGSRQIVGETDAMKSYELSRSPHADGATGCSNATPLGQRGQSDCTWEVVSPIGNAVLIGDSQAGHFSEAFIGAANQSRFDATLATMPGCPFVDLNLADADGNTAGYQRIS
jgi:peptidoglycan/LPS O-acetylase OafA/YrhL